MCPTPEERKTLETRPQAGWTTLLLKMQATEGDRHLQEVAVIRRIEAATIPTGAIRRPNGKVLNADSAAVSASGEKERGPSIPAAAQKAPSGNRAIMPFIHGAKFLMN